MKKTLIVALAGAFAVNANAGDYSKEVTEVIAPAPAIGATLSAGYDSTYVFRGVNNGENAVSVGLDYDLQALPLPVSLGAFYINPTDGGGVNRSGSDELQLSATVAGPDISGISTWLGYTAYLFPENGGRTGGDTTNEVGAGIGTSLGLIDLGVGAYYDFDIDGWYFDLTAGHTLALTDNIGLALSAGISFQTDYNAAGSDFNNVLLVAALPIELTDTATLSPYIAGTISLDAVDSYQDDELFGGVSLSVSF